MHKNNKTVINIILLISIILLIFLNVPNVYAADQKATCVYDVIQQETRSYDTDRTYNVTYEYINGVVTYSVKYPSGYKTIISKSTIVASNFNATTGLVCPTIYVKANFDFNNTKFEVYSSFNGVKNLIQLAPTDRSVIASSGPVKTVSCGFVASYPGSKLTKNLIVTETDGKINATSNDSNTQVTLDSSVKVEDVVQNGKCVYNFKSYCIIAAGTTSFDSSGATCFVTKNIPSTIEDMTNTEPNPTKELNLTADDLSFYNSNSTVKFQTGVMSCSSISNLLNFLDEMYGLIIVFMVSALIIFGMIGFGQATMSEKPEAMKIAIKNFRTRVIIVVIIVLLPSLLNTTFSIFTGASDKPKEICIPGL